MNYKQPKEEKKAAAININDLTFTKKFPYEYQEYLDKYCSNENYKESYFFYCPQLKRLAFWYHERAYQFAELRSLHDKPKVITVGRKPAITFPMPTERMSLVVVEDIFSALQISHVMPAMSMFGSSLPIGFYEYIRQWGVTQVIFWMDADKLKRSTELRDTTRTMGVKSEVIYSPKDPKAYSIHHIKEFLKDYLPKKPPKKQIEIRPRSPEDELERFRRDEHTYNTLYQRMRAQRIAGGSTEESNPERAYLAELTRVQREILARLEIRNQAPQTAQRAQAAVRQAHAGGLWPGAAQNEANQLRNSIQFTYTNPVQWAAQANTAQGTISPEPVTSDELMNLIEPTPEALPTRREINETSLEEAITQVQASVGRNRTTR